MWLGLAPRTDTQIQWHRYIQMGWQAAAAGAGRGREQQCRLVHARPSGHAPVGRSPAVSAGDNTLHAGGGGGRRLHGWAWKGPEDKSKRAGGSFPGWTSAVDVGAATFTHGQCMARSHLNHAEWQGGWGCGVQARDQILNSTRSGWDSR